jgi:hypothetical protein
MTRKQKDREWQLKLSAVLTDREECRKLYEFFIKRRDFAKANLYFNAFRIFAVRYSKLLIKYKAYAQTNSSDH